MLQFFLVCGEVDTLCSVCGRRHSVGAGVHMCTDRPEACARCLLWLLLRHALSLNSVLTDWLEWLAPQLQRSACLYPSPRTSVVDAHWPHLASLCRCWDLDSGNSLYDTLLTEPSPSLLIYFWSIIVNNLQSHICPFISLLFSSEKHPLQLRDK